MKKISLMLVDDHEMVRLGLSSYLNMQEDLEVVAEAVDGLDGVRKSKQYTPDVILMDLVMDKMDGIASSKAILQDNPEMKILILTSFLDDEKIFPALEAGVKGYILKTSQAHEIAESVRKLPMGDDVCDCFRTILEQREAPQIEKMVDGYSGFLFLDDDGMPLVAMHWEHRFNHMVKRYNEIFREQMPNITPHVCRHTYCSIQARAGMYPKTLQYLMGHSDIGVTMNTYTHLGLEDALEEVGRMQELENARKEQEKLAGKKEETKVSKRMLRAG